MSKVAVAAKSAAPASKPRTECPISKEDFNKHAVPLTVKIGENVMAASPKEFSTGSFGYYSNGKTVVEINGVAVTCQVGITVTAIGSKPEKSGK
jgi:hypothetical protein